MIEIGIPFSDPVAEGGVIQEASMQALAKGVTTDKIFDMVESIRDKVNIPRHYLLWPLRTRINRGFAAVFDVGRTTVLLPIPQYIVVNAKQDTQYVEFYLTFKRAVTGLWEILPWLFFLLSGFSNNVYGIINTVQF